MFKQPEEVMSGLKFLIYGATGTGKTWFTLSAPEIVGIDTEDGWARYIKKPIGKNIKYILTSSSASDLEEALDEIDEELVGKFKTFALDSYTKIYENQQFALQSLAEKRQRQKGKRLFWEENGQPRLHAENKSYNTKDVDIYPKEMTIQGIALKVIRNIC